MDFLLNKMLLGFLPKTVKDKLSHQGFQKYFQSLGWLFGSKLLSLVVSFLTTVFIARNLGPGNFGQLSYAVSFVGIFSFIASLGIDNILYRDLIKYPDKKNEVLGSAFAIKLVAGVVTTVLIIVSALFFVQDDVSMILVFILSGTFIFNSIQIINYEFQARVENKQPAIISFAVSIILNILKVLVILFGKGVIYLSIILLLESVLYAIFYWFAYENKLGGKIREWKFDKSIATSLLRDSWPLIFSSAFALIYARIDQVLIKQMIDAQSVGIYDAAVGVAEAWYFVPSIIIASLFPAIINAKISSPKVYSIRLVRLTLLLTILSILVGIVTSILAPFIMFILYGTAYMGGIIILQIYVWSGIAVALSNITSNYLITENYRKILFFTYFISMISNVVLNLIFIPKYGIVGSAYATLISYSLGPLSLLFFSQTRKDIMTIYRSSRKNILYGEEY